MRLTLNLFRDHPFNTERKSQPHEHEIPVSGTLPLDRPLNVEEIRVCSQNRGRLKSVGKIAQVWSEIALEKQQKAQMPHERGLFQDNSGISRTISQNINQRFSSLTSKTSFFICRDVALNQPQAMAMVTCMKNQKDHTDYLYLDYLTTHPGNIRSETNKEEQTRVTGAATAIMHHLKQTCLNKGFEEVKLYALHSAKPFYQKMGFENQQNSDNFFLKKAKIQQLFAGAGVIA